MRKRNQHRPKAALSPATMSEPSPDTDGLAALSARHVWRMPLLASGGLLVLYVATMAPSVVGGDSGELTATALSGGVPHAPGYPLFAILARLLGALPLGHSPAWHVNLLSAASTAAAGGVLCALVQLWSRSAVAGLVAAAVFGTDSVVWLHATAAEVFGLNAFFVAVAFFLWLCIERGASRRFVFALALASGLAMCNHHTFAFVGLPLGLRSLWVARRSLGARGAAIAAGLGLVGLVPYAYLASASASAAPVSWGDQTTLTGLLDHVLRRSYGTFRMGQAGPTGVSAFAEQGTFLPAVWSFLGHAFGRLTLVGVPLAVAGFYTHASARRERKPILVLGATFAFYVLVFAALCNLEPRAELYLVILQRFCIQSDLMLAIAAGLGCAKVLPLLLKRWPALERKQWLGYLVPGLVFLAGIAAHSSNAHQRKNRVFPDFVQQVLASLPANAIVISFGDHVSGAVSYFQAVEKLRPDVIHLDRELLTFPWYTERKRRLYAGLYLPQGGYSPRGWNIKQLLDGNPTRPLVVIDQLDAWDDSWTHDRSLTSQGLIHRLVPKAELPSFEEWVIRDREALGDYDVLLALRSPAVSWEHAVGRLVLTTQGVRAHIAMVYAIQGKNPAAARQCARLIEDIVAKAGGEKTLGIAAAPGVHQLDVAASAWKDLGVCYEILSTVDPSYAPRVGFAVRKFAQMAKADDPGLAAARKYMETHPSEIGPGDRWQP